jgi:hypothetical protein
VALKDQTAYVADGPEGLQVVDLSTPSQPRLVGTFKTPSPPRDVALGAGAVYVAVASGNVLILRAGPGQDSYDLDRSAIRE